MTIDLTLCMVVKNEATLIESVVGAAMQVCEQAIIVDTGSTDGTTEILKKKFNIDAKHFRMALEDPHNIVPARNAVLKLVRTQWMLWLDGDELLTLDGISAIRSMQADSPSAGFFGSWQHFHYPAPFSDYKLFIVKNLPKLGFGGRVHSTLTHSIRIHGWSAVWLPGLEVEHIYSTNRSHRYQYVSQLVRDLSDQPNSPRLLWFLGLHYYELHDWGKCEFYLQAAASSECSHFPVEKLNARLKLAELCAQLGKHGIALQHLNEGRTFFQTYGNDFEVVVNNFPAWISSIENAIRCRFEMGYPLRRFAQ